MLSRHKASSVPWPDGEVTREVRARNEPNHMIHEDVGEEDGVTTCLSYQWPKRGDGCLECASVSQHTRWKPHANNKGMKNVLRPMTAPPPTPQTPVFQQILSIVLYFKMAEMLGSTQPYKQQFVPMSICSHHEHTGISACGTQQIPQKFFKPIPKVLLITEIKMLPHYP